MVNLYQRYYWVIENRLLAGCYPGALDSELAEKQLSGLLNAGIRHVINLMEPHEKTWYGRALIPYRDQLRLLSKQVECTVSFERQPIRDLSVPTPGQMRVILDHIDDSLSLERPVYVHCLGGIGRTGTVVGCYLIRHGLATGENVLERLKQLRSNYADRHRRSPETDEQLGFVKTWEPGE